MRHGITNKALKKALLDKLSITAQALSQRVQIKIKENIGLTTPHATYLIAHEEGLRIDGFLSKEELENFTKAISSQPVIINKKSTNKISSKPKIKGPRKIIINLPRGKTFHDPMLENSTIQEASNMANVYALVYLMENSIRNLIISVLEKKYGKDWWNSGLGNSGKIKKIKTDVSQRMQDENKRKWHQKRGAHQIFYTDFNDLGTIIFSKKSDFFSEPLGDDVFILGLFNEINPSRNVLCHMNPLENDSIADIRLKYSKWLKIVKMYLK